MLGSSAIANPQPLLNNDNPLLTKGFWTLAGTSIEGATQSWTNSWLLDFVIQFKGDPGNWVVRKLDIGRIHRSIKFGPKGSLVEYKAFETKSNVVEPIEDNIPIDKWPERLKDTKWIRSPEILGNSQSGPKDHFNDMIHITTEGGDMYVTFSSRDSETWGAQKLYKITEGEVVKVPKDFTI
ncbi:hypothetical protein AX14_011258 [Amanita brunnescens Koide BX004]|nr:hypothetical protein AX14_011258 [Amanita brunnescens Koide BX004]